MSEESFDSLANRAHDLPRPKPHVPDSPQLEDDAAEARRLREHARDAMNQGDMTIAAYFNQAAGVHASLAVHDQLVAAAERENLCPHGGTGLCMYCLIPHIEQIGGQITNQIWSSLQSGVGRARGGW